MPSVEYKLILDKSGFVGPLKESEAQAAASTGAITASLQKLNTGGASASQGIHLVSDALKMSRSEIREANGTIALLGDTMGIRIPRHARTMISSLEYIGPALNAAFSAVAVLAIGKALFEAGEKVAEFFKKASEAAEKNERASAELSSSLEKTNLTLAVSNDKLEKQIGLITKKPVNGLKLALDEAKLSAMALASELDVNIQKERSLLQSSDANWMQRTLQTSAGTGSGVVGLNAYQGNVRSVENQYNERARKSSSPEQSEKIEQDRKAALRDVTVAYYNSLTEEIEARKELQYIRGNPNAVIDQAKHEAMLSKYGRGDQTIAIEAGEQQRGNIGALGTGMDLQLHQSQLEQRKELADAEKAKGEIAKAGATAAQKAQMERFEAALQEQRKHHAVTVGDEIRFWAEMQAQTVKGSANWLKINASLATETQTQIAKAHATIAAALKAATRSEGDSPHNEADLSDAGGAKMLLEESNDALRAGPKWKAFNAEVAKSSEIQDKLAAELALTKIQIQLSTGALSPHDAAVKTATAHAKEYADRLATLRAELAGIRADASLSPQDKQTQIWKKQNEIDSTVGEAANQGLKDDNAKESKTLSGAWNEKLNSTVNDFKNTPDQMKQGFDQFLGGMNAGIENLLTGQKTNWSAFLKQMASSLLGDGLKQAEAFGMSFLPHHADGGYTGTGPMVVGERGMEIFNPGVSGSITPNHKIGVGGSGAPTIGYIDARGTDPSLSAANFQRALHASQQQAVHDAAMVTAERSRRVPH